MKNDENIRGKVQTLKNIKNSPPLFSLLNGLERNLFKVFVQVHN